MNKQSINNNYDLKVKFTKFKNSNDKVDCYVNDDFIKDNLKISNNNIKKAYLNRKNKSSIIKHNNKIYFNQQGFEYLLTISNSKYLKNEANILLTEYRYKNYNNKDTITKQSVEGAINRNRQPLSINILKFDNEIFLIAHELVESVNCSSRDFMKALDKKMFFDKTNYKTLREKKRYKTIAMNKTGFLQICRELKLKKEQYEKVLSLYK